MIINYSILLTYSYIFLVGNCDLKDPTVIFGFTIHREIIFQPNFWLVSALECEASVLHSIHSSGELKGCTTWTDNNRGSFLCFILKKSFKFHCRLVGILYDTLASVEESTTIQQNLCSPTNENTAEDSAERAETQIGVTDSAEQINQSEPPKTTLFAIVYTLTFYIQSRSALQRFCVANSVLEWARSSEVKTNVYAFFFLYYKKS